MITIVYSTRKENPVFQEELKKTIGVKKYQVLEYVNDGEYSLTELYNKGLKEAENDIVVFCHDDIYFDKKNWGRRLLNNFSKNPEFGIIGIAGSTQMGEDGCWWTDRGKMVGIVNHSHEGKKWTNKYSGNFQDKIIETVTVYGLFFAVDKTKRKKEFNESFEGFHFYDVDFSFNNHLNDVKVGVCFNVRVTHRSIGMTNQEWDNNRLKFTVVYRDDIPRSVTPEIIYDEKNIRVKKQPKLGIVIPTKDNLDLLFKCLDSIYDKTQYENFKIYVADTGSTPENKEKINEYVGKKDNLILVEYDYYNFGKINNDVVNNHVDSDTELLLFCNNDIELLNDAISRVVNTHQKNKSKIGTVGARLHFEDNTVQHNGIFMMVNKENQLQFGHLDIHSAYSYTDTERVVAGNTGAFLLVSKVLFDKIGGFNEDYVECLEDVELNLECVMLNRVNVVDSSAVCYHYEGKTRDEKGMKDSFLETDMRERLIPFINEKYMKLNKVFLTPQR